MKLKPGYYRLTCDVTNPHPDRRKTREITAAPVWKKGTRFAVREQLRDVNTPVLTIEFADDRHAILTRRYEWDEAFKVIAPHLDPIAPDLYLTLHKLMVHDSRSILDRLVRSGRVTLGEVEEAAAELEAEYEAEDEAREARNKEANT